MHTTVSDGTDTPEEIIGKVKEAGIEMFSVTDHDAIKFSEQVMSVISHDDPVFVSGIEFSCKDEDGKYHILGYRYTPVAAGIRQVVEKGHELRMKKVRARLDFLRDEFGFSFPGPALHDLLSLDNPGKPHIGNMMVRFGYADTKEHAIDNFINKKHFKSAYLRPEEAIAGIIAAGGIPVLAHPSYGSGSELYMGDDLEHRVKKLLGFGIRGLEAYYSVFSPKMIRENLELANKYDLYVTAGSDYHGKNKIVSLGDTSLDSVSQGDPRVRKFINAVLEG